MTALKEIYEKYRERDIFPNELVELIMDCYKYGIFKDTKANRAWFKEAYETEYPETVEDLDKSLLRELKKTVKARRSEENFRNKMKQQRAERGYSDSDSWNIYSWFLEVMPKALQSMRDNLHGCPDGLVSSGPDFAKSQLVQSDNDEDTPEMKKWKEILDRMIFLLKEMNEETCSMENPYEKDYNKANDKFHKKYGFFGQNFEKINNIQPENENGKRIYFISDDPDHPEWAELSRDYINYEKVISLYRDKCREEFFNLFSYWFWDLWD